jgi:NADH dehydrogenase FAD-containing subunit
MKSRKSLAIIGGGYISRAIAKRLQYDLDVTVISACKYSMSNHKRVSEGLKLRSGSIETDFRSEVGNFTSFVEDYVHSLSKLDNKYSVRATKYSELIFDNIIIATGLELDILNPQIFKSISGGTFTLANPMQAMRLKNNLPLISSSLQSISKGVIYPEKHVSIISSGIQSSNIFNAIQVEFD